MIRITAAPKRFATAVKRPLKKGSAWDGRASVALAPVALERRSAAFAFPAQTRAFSTGAGLGSGGGGRGLQTSAPVRSQAAVEADEDCWKASDEIVGAALHGPRPEAWWTGKPPAACPGVLPDGQMSSLPQLNVKNCSRQALLDYFDNTWTLTEVLFSAPQGEEAFTAPPYHELRHPLVFYYGHPAALYVNKLRVAALIQDPIDPYFESVFETGVDEMTWDDLSKNRMEWPSIAAVHAYRRQVYRAVRDVIAAAPDALFRGSGGESGIMMDSPYWALPMAFEHERIHLETSSVLMREMPAGFLRAPAAWPTLHPSVPRCPVFNPVPGVDFPAENPLLPVGFGGVGGGIGGLDSGGGIGGLDSGGDSMRGGDGGVVTLGKPRDFPSFGWDNEYGERTYRVAPFAAARCKATNGEFLEFVRASGYGRRELWSEEGWGWRAFRNAKWPPFWVPQGPSGLHHFKLRTIFEEVPMPWDWPVEVNFHEAAAFARWKTEKAAAAASAGVANSGAAATDSGCGDGGRGEGALVYRVISELEHHLIRGGPAAGIGGAAAGATGRASASAALAAGVTPEAVDPVLGTAGRMAADSGANCNLSFGSASPVTAMPPNDKGFHDVFGNVWEWTIDHFSALPGFRINRLYEDFSTPCFDGQHHVIMGGSFASTGNEASAFARYHFRPHFHQHAGFRLVATPAIPGGSLEAAVLPMTSCTDAPPPYVGTSYPFRLSRADGAGGAISGGVVSADDGSALRAAVASHYATAASGGGAGVIAGLLVAPPGVAEALEYPRRCAALANAFLEADDLAQAACVLDVGCGPGAAAFELARVAARVVAVDASREAIEWARGLQAAGRAELSLVREGRLTATQAVRLAGGLGAAAVAMLGGGAAGAAGAAGRDDDALANRVQFRQADPMCLPAEFVGFDAVLVHSVLDRVPSPNSLLARMGGARGAVRPGGLAVVCCAFDWRDVDTPEGGWLGGFVDGATGAEVGGVEGIGHALGPEFELVHREEMPWAVPRSARTYDYKVACATVWRRGGGGGSSGSGNGSGGGRNGSRN